LSFFFGSRYTGTLGKLTSFTYFHKINRFAGTLGKFTLFSSFIRTYVSLFKKELQSRKFNLTKKNNKKNELLRFYFIFYSKDFYNYFDALHILKEIIDCFFNLYLPFSIAFSRINHESNCRKKILNFRQKKIGWGKLTRKFKSCVSIYPILRVNLPHLACQFTPFCVSFYPISSTTYLS
jgi:hypothetical protein